MNPPFENGQSGQHVRRAFEFLRPGGVLVAITGAGLWFREDAASKAFREWFATLDCWHNEELPSGTFNASDVTQRTNVVSRLIAVRRGA